MSSSNQDPRKSMKEMGDGFLKCILNNKWESVVYLILLIALVCSIFERFIGGLIVGVIVGAYFSTEIKERFENFKDALVDKGIFHSFVLIALLLAILIASPGLFLGVILGAIIKKYVNL